MSQPRLVSDERHRSIVEAAVPLFARKGFAGTTTKEIAEAARVSEALVFKHFPSKAALYEEIVHQGCQGDPRLEDFLTLTPSTAALIDMVHYMLRYSILGLAESSDLVSRQRLMVNSFLEDGEYARLVLDWIGMRILPKVEECLAVARDAGDLVALPIGFANRFWFGHHVAAMMAFVRLPGRGVVPYRDTDDQLIVEAAWFILRGLGIKDDVIAAHRIGQFPGLAAAAQ